MLARGTTKDTTEPGEQHPAPTAGRGYPAKGVWEVKGRAGAVRALTGAHSSETLPASDGGALFLCCCANNVPILAKGSLLSQGL